MADAAQVVVNGRAVRLPDGTPLAGLLEQIGRRDEPCAVEVNERLVPRGAHAEHRLHDGDRVEIVTLVGGG